MSEREIEKVKPPPNKDAWRKFVADFMKIQDRSEALEAELEKAKADSKQPEKVTVVEMRVDEGMLKELRQRISQLEAELAEAKKDSERLDRLDKFEPPFLVSLVTRHCVRGDKTVREMLDWIHRNL